VVSRASALRKFVVEDPREAPKVWHNHVAVSVVGPNLFAGESRLSTHLSGLAAGGLFAGDGDPGSTRLVYAMVIGLASIGVLFVLLAIWMIRQTKVDLEMLAPLERMGDREWRKSDPASQRRSLDELRPSGAEPLQTEPHRPRVDSEFEQSDRPVQSFDDLVPVSPEGSDPTPTGVESDELLTSDAQAEDSEVDDSDSDSDSDVNDSEEPETETATEVEEPVAEVEEPETQAEVSGDESAQRLEQ